MATIFNPGVFHGNYQNGEFLTQFAMYVRLTIFYRKKLHCNRSANICTLYYISDLSLKWCPPVLNSKRRSCHFVYTVLLLWIPCKTWGELSRWTHWNSGHLSLQRAYVDLNEVAVDTCLLDLAPKHCHRGNCCRVVLPLSKLIYRQHVQDWHWDNTPKMCWPLKHCTVSLTVPLIHLITFY